jgi:hypothetical protein
VVFGPPPAEVAGGSAGLTLTLLSSVPDTPGRASRVPAPLRLLARYLVTATGPTGAEADRLIVNAAFAALEAGTPDIEREAPRPELWTALGVTARLAMVIRTHLERPRAVAPVRRVREVETRWAHSRPLSGRVLGPDDTPIADALIEVEATGATTYSDHRGEFHLPAVPIGPPAATLAVMAKGVRLVTRAEAAPEASLLIRVPLPEL